MAAQLQPMKPSTKTERADVGINTQDLRHHKTAAVQTNFEEAKVKIKKSAQQK